MANNYSAPEVEIIELEVEDAVLQASGDANANINNYSNKLAW